MTKEEEIVRNVFDSYIRDLKAISTKKDRPTFDMLEEVKNKAIKALEQPTSEDCVSRTQALSAIRNLYPSAPFVRMNLDKWQEKNKKYFECEDIIKALPPVTSTHGTCKDCSHYDPLTCNSGTCLNPNMSWSNEVPATHYCTDYGKRGNKE